MSTRIRPLPEFIQFKKDMEAAGQLVAIYDDGTPFVHTFEPQTVEGLTEVATEHFEEAFDDGATKCVYPVVVDDEGARNHRLALVGHQ